METQQATLGVEGGSVGTTRPREKQQEEEQQQQPPVKRRKVEADEGPADVTGAFGPELMFWIVSQLVETYLDQPPIIVNDEETPSGRSIWRDESSKRYGKATPFITSIKALLDLRLVNKVMKSVADDERLWLRLGNHFFGEHAMISYHTKAIEFRAKYDENPDAFEHPPDSVRIMEDEETFGVNAQKDYKWAFVNLYATLSESLELLVSLRFHQDRRRRRRRRGGAEKKEEDGEKNRIVSWLGRQYFISFEGDLIEGYAEWYECDWILSPLPLSHSDLDQMADEIATYLNDERPNKSEEFFEAAGEDEDKAKEMARKTFALARATCMWPEIQWPSDVENEDIQHFDGDLDGLAILQVSADLDKIIDIFVLFYKGKDNKLWISSVSAAG